MNGLYDGSVPGHDTLKNHQQGKPEQLVYQKQKFPKNGFCVNHPAVAEG